MNATFMYTDTWGIYQGTVDNLTDGDSSTALDFSTSGDRTRKGDYIGWDLGKETAIGKVYAVIGEIVVLEINGKNIVYNTLMTTKTGLLIKHIKVQLVVKIQLKKTSMV